MKFFIDHIALERLTDSKLETRQNALREITSIMKNNILVEERSRNPHADSEFGVVNLEILTRQLIRWFKFRPVTNETEIFDLLIMIFSREDFLRHITKTFSLERLRKEMIKISKLVIPDESSTKLHKIEELLSKFEYGLLVDVANETGSFMEIKSSETSIQQHIDNTLLDRMQRMALSPTPSTGSKCDEDEDDNFCVFWINLEGSNLDNFNFIDNELLNYKDETRFRNILKFLTVSVSDFPPEFFLQPPNVLETLIDLFPKVSHANSIEILRLIHFVINGLKQRCIEAVKKNFQYISIKKHMNKIFQMFINIFEGFHDNFSKIDINKQQEILNSIYLILFDVVDLLECTQDVCDIYINELLNMLAKLVRDFRQNYEDCKENVEICRLNYIVGIYLINAFVSRIDTENITKFSENNLWEFESDLALLDWPLKNFHTQIYNLIKENRITAIKDDKDMMLLLNVEVTWKPVIELFQNWETMTDEAIIYRGLKCLDTIRIHKNVKFVELLFKTIEKCADRMNTVNRLKTSAEEIVLRLLSIDVPEIRLKAYAIAKEYVQKKLTDDHDDRSKNADLTAILGIPITTEIVTEVLCFGYCDENEEIYKNAKLILFALLRAKVVFPNHWSKILEAIRPVLPLVPCLFNTDQKLGFFSFDVFHEHSGFEEYELQQAFARFLFCTYSKAREMAKCKLLESFRDTELTNELIDIVPDDFCIIKDNLVTELQMPDKNIRFDQENYETIKNVLTAVNHSDVEVLQTVLLQLSVQMNSLKMCHKSHNDNLWIYFMADLEMGNPNNEKIRKLTINILHKWVVSVPSFRIYLANEPSMLRFLIKTLIMHFDDQQIKVQTSSLLFLLVFSDFVVATERKISLPKFIKNLACPFKFDQHWTESPFNKITQLEWMYEALEAQHDNTGVQEITLRHLRFSFSSAWFARSPSQLQSSDYNSDFRFNNLCVNALMPSEKLLPTEKDHMIKKHTSIKEIMLNACTVLENVATVSQLTHLVHKITCSLMLPNKLISTFAEDLARRIKRLSVYDENHAESRKYMLIKSLELCEKIVPNLSISQIIKILDREPLTAAFGKGKVPDENIYIQSLKLINSIVKICEDSKDLRDIIIKHFNSTHKIHFPSRLAEKLFEHLFEVTMKDKSWTDVTKIPSVKVIFTLLRNVLQLMPVELDEKYVNEMFSKLITATREFLKSKKKTFLNTHTVNQMFGIIDVLTSLNYSFNLKSEDYSTLFLWIKEKAKVQEGLIWSIIGNLTRKKDGYDKFCDGFKDELGFSVFDMIFEKIQTGNDHTSTFELNGLALVMANYLDHATDNKNELKVATNKHQMRLITGFFDQKPVFHTNLSFLVKKLIQNKIPETTGIVKRKKVVEKVLYNSIENLDMVTLCYTYDDLKEHVADIVVNIHEATLIEFFRNLKNATDKEANSSHKCEHHHRTNHNILNILLILMTSVSGAHKIRKIFIIPNLIEAFTMAVFGGLKITNPVNEITYHVRFLNSLLAAFDMAKCQISSSIFGSLEPEIKFSKKFQKIPEEFCGENCKKTEMFIFDENFRRICYVSDLFFLQAIKIFGFVNYSKHSNEQKYEMRLSTFTFIRNLLEQSERARKFAAEVKLEEWIVETTKNFLNNPAHVPAGSYFEVSKKHGAQKCKFIIKNLCIFLKAITEWKLPVIKNSTKLKNLFEDFKNIYSWIESDVILMNCFYQFIQYISPMPIIKSCIMQEFSGSTMLKDILKRIQSISTKIPHTESNLMLLRNGLYTIEKCSHMIEVRLFLRNSKVFQILDLLHPQIQSNKKSTWNEVTAMWLDFFVALSCYEDCDFTPGQVSLLCRIVRIGTHEMRLLALKTLRNVSIKSTLGYVVLISDDFMQTIDSILLEEGKNREKFLIVQTLVGIVSRSEQSRSKLKNSSFSRKLNENLTLMEIEFNQSSNEEDIALIDLTKTLRNILFF